VSKSVGCQSYRRTITKTPKKLGVFVVKKIIMFVFFIAKVPRVEAHSIAQVWHILHNKLYNNDFILPVCGAAKQGAGQQYG